GALAEHAETPSVDIFPSQEPRELPADLEEHSSPSLIETAPFVSPVPLHRTTPNYPLVAFSMKLTGTVGLLVRVSADGKVTDVRVRRSAGPPLDKAAVTAARSWTYKPALKGNQPVNAWVEERVEFKLK